MFFVGNMRNNAKADLEAISRSLGIIEFDPQGNVLYANPNFCKVLGYDLSEIKGRHHSLFVASDYAQSAEYREFWSKLRRGEFDAREYKRLGKGGREVWIQASYNPVKDRRGRVRKVVKIATDITAAKLLAAENQGKLDAISRAQGVIEFNTDGTIITANENFMRAVGYSLDEVRGKHHRVFVEPAYAQSNEYREFWARLNRGEYVADEFRRIGKGGKEVYIQASYNPIFDLNKHVIKVVKFATDVTDRVHSVNSIASALDGLASGDLTRRLDVPLIPSLEKLRVDFNRSVDAMQRAMRQVGESGRAIAAGTSEIRAAADDLSRRTEQQAASLEETAAAVAEITTTVKNSARSAQEAGSLVGKTKANAEKSGEIVRQAVSAMSRIKSSSDQISNIISIIDEIAFQTNLLALNAGVEAARAGEAGRGFAVVASEVRALAQRSADAAKEIKNLITQSGEQVESGVGLVGETGKALTVIVEEMQEIFDNVSSIVDSAQRQAISLDEVNTAVGAVDQNTQQNAAMVEETTAASHSLGAQVEALTELLSHFRLGDAGRERPAKQSAPARSSRPAAPRTSGALALANQEDENEWQEF